MNTVKFVLISIVLCSQAAYANDNEKLCEKGNRKACDKVAMISHDKDLSSLLAIHQGTENWKIFGGFKKLTLYTGQSFIPIQKIKGGYLFSGNPQYFRGMSFSPAHLQTTAKLEADKPFCAFMYYVGEYQYTAIDGFERKIPSFRVYNGTPDKLNPHCDSERLGRVLEK